VAPDDEDDEVEAAGAEEWLVAGGGDGVDVDAAEGWAGVRERESSSAVRPSPSFPAQPARRRQSNPKKRRSKRMTAALHALFRRDRAKIVRPHRSTYDAGVMAVFIRRQRASSFAATASAPLMSDDRPCPSLMKGVATAPRASRKKIQHGGPRGTTEVPCPRRHLQPRGALPNRASARFARRRETTLVTSRALPPSRAW